MKICIGLNPNSYLPSAVDFNSNFSHNYVLGVICCHDGRAFIYNANELIDEDLYAAYVNYPRPTAKALEVGVCNCPVVQRITPPTFGRLALQLKVALHQGTLTRTCTTEIYSVATA